MGIHKVKSEEKSLYQIDKQNIIRPKNTKRIKILTGIVIVLVGLFAYVLYINFAPQGDSNNAKISVDHSKKFSKDEIEQAVEIVKEKFKSFNDCKMTEIWYDEKFAENANKENKNTIILLSNFKTGKKSASEGFEPNYTYENWTWTLVRKNEQSPWRLVSWGVS